MEKSGQEKRKKQINFPMNESQNGTHSLCSSIILLMGFDYYFIRILNEKLILAVITTYSVDLLLYKKLLSFLYVWFIEKKRKEGLNFLFLVYFVCILFIFRSFFAVLKYKIRDLKSFTTKWFSYKKSSKSW